MSANRLVIPGRDTCSGACHESYGCDCCRNAPCPTPQACEVAEPELEALTPAELLRFWAFPCIALCTVGAAAVWAALG